jgi:tRNA(Ile)-lysidine synthase
MPLVTLSARISACLRRHLAPGQRLLLGLSGGLDSRVLLHLLVDVRQKLDLSFSAIHIDHRISPNADDWAGFCAELCARDDVSFQTVAVDVPRDSGLGLEAAAREVRYRVLLGEDADAVMLAHHQDDQAETLFLQLLRGAGVKGLAAMGEISTQRLVHGGRPKMILRPLLEVSRAELLEYARAHDLKWIDDESNFDVAYDRNFLRSRILPELEHRFPSCRRTMARSASHLAEAAELLEEIAREDALLAVGDDGHLNLQALKGMTAARAGNLLRYWVTAQSGLALSAARIEDIRSQLLDSRVDARIHIKISSAVLSRKRGKAIIE